MARGGPRPGAGRPKKNRVQGNILQTEKLRTALEILEQAANDTSLDWKIRVDAAKALAPYQSKRAGGFAGKKNEKLEAAKKASTGRFAPAPGPKVVPIK